MTIPPTTDRHIQAAREILHAYSLPPKWDVHIAEILAAHFPVSEKTREVERLKLALQRCLENCHEADKINCIVTFALAPESLLPSGEGPTK